MSRPFAFESFDETGPVSAHQAEGLSEEKWLEAFEKGYKDGWDDAERALTLRQGQVSDAFAQNLMDLSFTLSEARISVRRDLSSLLRGVLNSLLPENLSHLLGPQILADLDALSDTMSGTRIEIVVAAEQQQVIERMLGRPGARPASVIGAAHQPLNTAMIRFGGGEREIDLPAALAEISATIEAYFDEPEQQEDRANG